MSYTVFINRKWQSELSTVSEFSISGTDVNGYILERPGPDTTTSDLRKRIPEGTYYLKWHVSAKFGKHSPVPLLYNSAVAADRYILIHPGNGPDDTDGCLLPGSVRLSDRIGSSVAKYNEIKNCLTEKGIENFIVMITSCYVNGK